jgi:uncharacterized Zn finger protein
MSGYKVECPLCGADMPLTELESKPNGRENKSYIWICNECPGILLEWWDHKDTDAFRKYIEYHEGIIKQWGDVEEETNANVKDHLLSKDKE